MSQRCTTCMRLLRKSLGRSSHTLRFTGVQRRFLASLEMTMRVGATLIFRLLETYFPTLFHTASALSAPSGHLPLEGKALGVGQRYSRFAAFSMAGRILDFSLLWKEVSRRGGGWLPQRDEPKSEIAHPPVSSSRAQPRDLSCRRENSTYEEVRHSKSYEVRCLPLISHSPFHRCARKISRFARNDDTRKALLPFFACLRRISPLAFIPPVPYPPLRDTFPSRGRLFMTSGEAAPFISHSSRVFFYFFFQYATSVSAAPMPRAVLMPMPVYMAKEARVAARLAAMSFLKKP